MKLPWNREKDIEELKARIEELREERDSLEERFKAEKERRSKLATEKQEAEEELNRLQDRIKSLKAQKDDFEETENSTDFRSLGFDKTLRLLRKLESVESPEKDMVTVYSPGEVGDVGDLKGLRNVVGGDQMQLLQENSCFVAFLDTDVFNLVLKTRPFHDPEWILDREFSVDRLMEFINREKVWVTVSAGESLIYRESGGEAEEVSVVKTRVDREHSKGGYSQGRFERKRGEQVDQHLQELKEEIPEEEVFLLGDKRLTKELPGERLGGFDPNRSVPDVFYNFRANL